VRLRKAACWPPRGHRRHRSGRRRASHSPGLATRRVGRGCPGAGWPWGAGLLRLRPGLRAPEGALRVGAPFPPLRPAHAAGSSLLVPAAVGPPQPGPRPGIVGPPCGDAGFWRRCSGGSELAPSRPTGPSSLRRLLVVDVVFSRFRRRCFFFGPAYSGVGNPVPGRRVRPPGFRGVGESSGRGFWSPTVAGRPGQLAPDRGPPAELRQMPASHTGLRPSSAGVWSGGGPLPLITADLAGHRGPARPRPG